MLTDRMRVLLDSLGTVSEQERQRLSVPSGASASARNPLGLRFAAGARVLDLVTGQNGLVQHGTRDTQTHVELYRVQLADASVQYRSQDQLEPAAPAPGN